MATAHHVFDAVELFRAWAKHVRNTVLMQVSPEIVEVQS